MQVMVPDQRTDRAILIKPDFSPKSYLSKVNINLRISQATNPRLKVPKLFDCQTQGEQQTVFMFNDKNDNNYQKTVLIERLLQKKTIQ